MFFGERGSIEQWSTSGAVVVLTMFREAGRLHRKSRIGAQDETGARHGEPSQAENPLHSVALDLDKSTPIGSKVRL
jgi:hypothetical protein